MNLTAGGSETLTASVQPSNASNLAVNWSSSNTAAATVSSSGLVTAVAAGTAVITVTTADGGFKANCTVTVTAATVPVTGINLNKNSLSLHVNGTETLIATVLPANATNRNVNWSSSNPAVATVNASGLVTAVSTGTAVITARTADGNFSATANVTVNNNVTITYTWSAIGNFLRASQTNLTINKGQSVTITAPPGLGLYEWHVDGLKVDHTGNTYIFNSTGKEPGRYTISLWAGSSAGGDAIRITVAE